MMRILNRVFFSYLVSVFMSLSICALMLWLLAPGWPADKAREYVLVLSGFLATCTALPVYDLLYHNR